MTVHFYSTDLSDSLSLEESSPNTFVINVHKNKVHEETHHIVNDGKGNVGRLIINLLRIHQII